MNRLIAILLVLAVFTMSCANAKTIPVPDTTQRGTPTVEVLIQPYGLANMDEKNPNVHYQVSVGNIVWSVLLCETVFVPIILLGWYLWEPTGQASDHIPGVAN